MLLIYNWVAPIINNYLCQEYYDDNARPKQLISVAPSLCVCDIIQDEKALYGAAERGDVSVVRRMIATSINVNCTPYEV